MEITIEQRMASEYGSALEDAGIDHGITYLYDKAVFNFDIAEECEALEILHHLKEDYRD